MLTALGPAAAGPPERTQGPVATPGPGEVFQGYTLSTLTDGRMATREEFDAGLANHDPFYAEPVLTGTEAPGTLLKSKPVQVQFTGFRPAHLAAWKLMYVTTDLDGSPAISTGILMVPVDGRDDATRAVVGYQEANDSIGAYCHPSTQWTGGDPIDGASWSALGPLGLMFNRGLAVMITDVGNDGDPNPHGVFAGRFGGMANLDGLRAALALPEAGLSADAPIGLFGVAGGGVGAAFAAEYQPTYAPELNVRSAVLEGMVVNQRNFVRTASGSVGSGFAFAALLGLEPRYPQMRIDEKLTPVGKAIADNFRTQCQTPAYFALPFVPLNTLFVGGADPADIPDFQPVYDDNQLGVGTAPKSKVLITSCQADDSPMSLVPAQDARDLADRYRAGGTDVTYAGSNCSMDRFLTDIYGWGTDLFGMQTVDWLADSLN
ncbi:lipase family protein [Rhodococcus kronopolitis]|uniref:Lipase family protein n=1 Tax=Rhodococcus kronopolitis TaxID=1460226 RepID=A0ABV9FU08_9NOCA